MIEHPTLYKTTKTGKVHYWKCSIEKNIITRSDGDVAGKEKTTTREISGNSLRNSEQQAALESEKYWILQLDKGYKPDPKDKIGTEVYDYVMSQKSKNGGMNRGVKMYSETEIKVTTTAGYKDYSVSHYPMLSQKYLDHMETITFPVLVQAKCDGMRCMTYLENDNVVLESRNGKSYVHLNHIREDLKKILKPGIVLDGELYIHHLFREDGKLNSSSGKPLKNVERYQFLSESCKITRTLPHEYENLVQYWIFDILDMTKTNLERNKEVKHIMKGYKGSTLVLLPTHTADSHDKIEEFMVSYLEKDYEGVMIRNPNAIYVSKKGYHCRDLLKYKRFFDEEWVIVDAEQCQGTQKGAVTWICELNGKQVKAKQMGTVEASRKYYKDFLDSPETFIGKHINIRFNETTKDGIPRFPRAVALVEDKH